MKKVVRLGGTGPRPSAEPHRAGRAGGAAAAAAAFKGMYRAWGGASVLVVQDPSKDLAAGLAVLQARPPPLHPATPVQPSLRFPVSPGAHAAVYVVPSEYSDICRRIVCSQKTHLSQAQDVTFLVCALTSTSKRQPGGGNRHSQCIVSKCPRCGTDADHVPGGLSEVHGLG